MILDPESIWDYLRITTPDALQQRVLNLIQPGAERAAQRWLGYKVAEDATYVEYHPRAEPLIDVDPDFADAGADDLDQLSTTIIVLDHRPVTAISSVKVNTDAHGFAADFATTTDLDTDGYTWDSAMGRLINLSGAWPLGRGTVRVAYTAGYTEAQLTGDYADLRLGLIVAVADAWTSNYERYKQSQGGGAAGPVVEQTMTDEVRVRYAQPSQTDIERASGNIVLSSAAMRLLQPFRRYL